MVGAAFSGRFEVQYLASQTAAATNITMPVMREARIR